MLATRLTELSIDDISALERVERETGLTYWGRDYYSRFLREFPEYFGSKAVVYPEPGPGSFAGFVFARSIFENLEILKVGVAREYHRRGIGTLLMKAAYAEGIKRGCHRCFLEVRRSNTGALDFYAAQKFTVAGVRCNYYSDPLEDAIILERSF
jgi:ribosomal-protein-alanine N-acetyltransferase